MLPKNLTIGSTVWFHSREFTDFERPRVAYVAEPGAQPNLVNLTILMGPRIDVEENRKAPLLTRRNVPVLTAYPKHWPMEDFAVFPMSALQYMNGENTPNGGKLPLIFACSLTEVEPYGEAAMPAQEINRLAEAERKAELEEQGTPNGQASPPPPAPKPKAETPEPKTEPRSTLGLTAPMVRLTQHPSFSRAFDELNTAPEYAGDSIIFTNKQKIVLAELTHNPEGAKAGYLLKLPAGAGKKQGLAVAVEAAKTSNDIRRIIRIAARVAVEGAKLKTAKEAVALAEKAHGDIEA